MKEKEGVIKDILDTTRKHLGLTVAKILVDIQGGRIEHFSEST